MCTWQWVPCCKRRELQLDKPSFSWLVSWLTCICKLLVNFVALEVLRPKHWITLAYTKTWVLPARVGLHESTHSTVAYRFLQTIQFVPEIYYWRERKREREIINESEREQVGGWHFCKVTELRAKKKKLIKYAPGSLTQKTFVGWGKIGNGILYPMADSSQSPFAYKYKLGIAFTKNLGPIGTLVSASLHYWLRGRKLRKKNQKKKKNSGQVVKVPELSSVEILDTFPQQQLLRLISAILWAHISRLKDLRLICHMGILSGVLFQWLPAVDNVIWASIKTIKMSFSRAGEKSWPREYRNAIHAKKYGSDQWGWVLMGLNYAANHVQWPDPCIWFWRNRWVIPLCQ